MTTHVIFNKKNIINMNRLQVATSIIFSFIFFKVNFLFLFLFYKCIFLLRVTRIVILLALT
jgi:hypothetical protein